MRKLLLVVVLWTGCAPVRVQEPAPVVIQAPVQQAEPAVVQQDPLSERNEIVKWFLIIGGAAALVMILYAASI